MKRSILFVFLFLVTLTSPTVAQNKKLIKSAETLLENKELKAYHGWIKYLLFDAQVVAKRPGVDEKQATAKEERLANWVNKIKDDPAIIQRLRGPQEWAYESEADGSGQPFMINIPQDYDPEKAFPVSLYMHGYSGNHSEHYAGSNDLKGIIELSVLGRSRGGGYVGLSGADVLDVLDYVEAHWNVDPDRIHILGGSMGGNGTFRMGSLYPHRFASGRPTCGFGSDKPFGNLVTLPFYVTHSDDDPVVPILHSLGPIQRLQDMGGQAIYDWTTGYGHASWDYTEGNIRGDKWFRQQVRPNSSEVKFLNYTALSGEAMRSWWAEIEEWGDDPIPAKFILSTNDNNTLYANLENIAQLKLYVNGSPIDPDKTLQVSVNGEPLLSMNSPLPEEVYVVKTSNGWELLSSTVEAEKRRHTPGGPNLLYNGDPLIIVFGTQGSKEENEAMKNAAIAASKSSNAMWQSGNGESGPDGISHNLNLYGDLIIKADDEVTQTDMTRSHLVLIGNAKQNKVVASMSELLPVKITENNFTFSDGEEISSNGRGLGLVYYNPLAPKNLIFWVASNDHHLYRANSPVPELMAFAFPIYASAIPGYDCVITSVNQTKLITSRRFDSKWNWVKNNKNEACVSTSISSNDVLYEELANSIKKEAGADFSFFQTPNSDATMFIEPGITKIKDLVSQFYYEPIGIITLSGTDVLTVQDKLIKAGQSLYPIPTTESVIADKPYTLALDQINIWTLVRNTQYFTMNYQLTDLQMRDAIKRFFPQE